MDFIEQQQAHTEKLKQGIRNPFILAGLRGDNYLLPVKYLGGILLIAGGYILGQIPMGLLVLLQGMVKGADIEQLSNDQNSIYQLGIDNNLLFFAALLMFVIADIALWFVVRFVHKRTFLSVLTAYASINWKKIGIAFILYFGLSALTEGIGYFQNPENYVYQLQWSSFIPLVLITLLVMPFQTSFEELLFRGYLMQAFGILFKRSWPAVIITGLLFALMHSWNPEIDKFGFWVMFPFYFGFGLMLGFIVIKEKSLEIALAVHAANNMFSSIFLTFDGGALQTDAMFLQKTMDPLASMPYYFASMLVFLLACSFLFGWWRKKPSAEPMP